MTVRNIVALEEVALDLDLGELFYENQSIGLGNYFRDSILSDIESLWLYGVIHIKINGLYRLLSKRFPYGIYYDFSNHTITIVAVLDLRQNPHNIQEFLETREQKLNEDIL